MPKGYNNWRFVCDLRLVNLETKDDLMELPNLNHILDRVGDKNLYSTVDLSKSFHQVPYSKSSRPITAFMYNNRRYQFARMVMGMKSSSAKFCRMMQILIAGLPPEHIAYFIDDLILLSRDVKSHIQLLEMLFERLKQGNLKLTPKKCQFLREEVTYVGVTLTRDGLKINDERIECIKKLEPPKNKGELQSVLGVFNFSKRFIKSYSKLAKPLYSLLRKNS
ncbi:MAG: RNA-directed DNA polymerase, partial [Cytophagales bacterium]|nr:RNA-directed DNA polymerase [Cytophagales bacterium]